MANNAPRRKLGWLPGSYSAVTEHDGPWRYGVAARGAFDVAYAANVVCASLMLCGRPCQGGIIQDRIRGVLHG
jgi:hypothetical protein